MFKLWSMAAGSIYGTSMSELLKIQHLEKNGLTSFAIGYNMALHPG